MPEIRLAGCVIQDPQGRILLLHRSTPKRTQWEIPGGKLNPGEDERMAAKRELQEELGVDVALTRELGSRSFVEDGHTMTYTWFLATITSGYPHALERDTHDQCAFLSITELQRIAHELSANTANLLEEITDGAISL